MGVIATLENKRGFLLDTHTFLWALRKPSRLGKLAKAIIEDSEQQLYVSVVTAYEIANKYRLGKLDEFEDVAKAYPELVNRLALLDLPVSFAHAYQAGQMSWTHRDPFDRILAAQAALENLVLITDDAALAQHPWIKTIW